jgi:lysophospholipase L1-like esterase
MSVRRPARKLFAAILATVLALLLAEGALRWLPIAPSQPLGRLSYQTGAGEPVADLAEAVARGFVVPVDPKLVPRARFMFRPGLDFFLCYTDHERLQRDWFDAAGRVPVHINAAGIRDRDEITHAKPAGQRRLLCLGDSFTFGWGIREEDGWVRLLEAGLRSSGKEVRTVNCGAAGALCVDEYEYGLQHRFAAFQPDAVLVTLCLNDLLPSSGLCLVDPVRPTGLRLFDLARAAFGRSALDLDPTRDWVGELLALGKQAGEAAGYYGTDAPFEAMWSQGTPQRSLRRMASWCNERKIPLLVSLWPFLQGLGKGRSYPFARMHQLVADECAAAGIPFLDLLPALQDTPQEQLWVTPADMHANPTAQRLALPHLEQFVRQHWPQ